MTISSITCSCHQFPSPWLCKICWRCHLAFINETFPFSCCFSNTLAALFVLFFSECVVNIWNSLPVDTDFSSLACFIQQINTGGHKPGIVKDFSEHGKLSEFSGNSVNSVQPQGKIVTNKVLLVRQSNISVDWVNRIIMTLDEGHYYIYLLLR